MSQLILMRQRISAIETIKKVTHAMQLISMSNHSRLRQKKIYIEQYQQAINNIACSLQQYTPYADSPFQTPKGNKKLILIIGSQKGLCGVFNANLYKFFQAHETITANSNIIIIGRLAVDFFSYQGITPDVAYTNLTINNYVTLATLLTQTILRDLEDYQEIVCYHMFQKSFFLQEPKKVILFPLTGPERAQSCPPNAIEFTWEEDHTVIYQFVQELNLQASILEALFSSLLAEQAARFISMENATRNAENLLSDMKIEYNKTRQAKITLELTDLIAGTINS